LSKGYANIAITTAKIEVVENIIFNCKAHVELIPLELTSTGLVQLNYCIKLRRQREVGNKDCL